LQDFWKSGQSETVRFNAVSEKQFF